MRPQEHRFKQNLVRTDRLLQASSFALYTRLLSRLLATHRDYDFLQPLSDAVRRKDWPVVYSLGDSLSSQRYTDATSHFVANQFSLLIKKYPWNSKQVKLDPERAAIDSFFSAEKRCGRINRKFSFLLNDPSRDRFREEGKLAMNWIRSLLGTTPNMRAIAESCDFGSGASVGVHGDVTHVIRKLTGFNPNNDRTTKVTVTPGAIHLAFGGLMRNQHYMESLLPVQVNGFVCLDYVHAFEKYVSRLEIVDSNKLDFVTKTAKTHRSIAIEPLYNGFYQKGIDQVLRRKLLRAGLDLSDQSLNQRLAREGSLDDSDEGFVTIDLRGASNSNARVPVRYLYPPAWCDLLDRARSHYLSFRGEIKRYEMLCSMGNGFCFPIETITFSALCVAAGAGQPGVDFSVYGDDIIVRKKHAVKLVALLRHYGFALNTDKTFLEGPFRESCGSDWFVGEDVRPFTLDFALDNVENFFKFLNLTNRNARTVKFFASVRSLLVETLPVEFRLFRPFIGEENSGIDSLGDEHLISPNCVLSRDATWSWKELVRTSIVDYKSLERWGREPWLMGVALRGAASVTHGASAGLPEVTFRHRTRAKLTRKSYSSTSNWLPSPV